MKKLLKKPGVATPQELLEKHAVVELIEFERFCRDNAQWDEMKKCFTADATVKISWYCGSGLGFVEASSKMNSYAPHKLYNTLVWLDGDKAVAITMATIQIRYTIDGHLVELQSDTKLVYRTQKIGGVWLIVSFEAVYEKDSLIPVTPVSNISIPSEKIAKFRPSYANMSYALSLQGYDINNDLPGRDRPDSVTKLYEEADAWLTS